MESFLNLMNSIIYSWVSPSTIDTAIDMSIAILCGAGLYFLLTPFLKNLPVSPCESETDITEDLKMRQRKTRMKITTVKGCREDGKNVEETKIPSRPMKIKQLPQDSTWRPWWNPLQKMEHLPLFQLLSYLKFLEYLIHKEFSHIFWGISTLFSESVLATAHIFRSPSSTEHKTMRFCDACHPGQAPSQAQGPPECSQEQPLPAQLVTPSLLAVTKAQLMQIFPSSTPIKTPPCFKRQAFRKPYPTSDKGIQVSLSTEKHAWQHGQYWNPTEGDDIQKHQAAFMRPTQNLTLHSEAIRSGSILPEHWQMAHKNEGPQNEGKETNVGQEQGTPIIFLPSWRLAQLQGNFPAYSHYCKSRPLLSQSVHSSILDHKRYTWIKMRGSVPVEVPLREVIEKSEKHTTIKKGIGLGSKHLPCTSSSIHKKGLNPSIPTLRSDELSYMNPAEYLSMDDSNTERKLALDITELPVKHRRKSYLQILETEDLTTPGVPASNLPQVVFPSSPICDSKEEYYSKAATILENLHHQDPGGTRVESALAARLESALCMHSAAEVQENQRAPQPDASHGPSKAHPDSWQSHLSSQQPDFCLQAQPQQNRTIQGSETGSLQQNTSIKIDKYLPWKGFQYVDSSQPCCRVIVLGQDETIPPSAAKPSNRVEVKEEPSAWTVSLGSSEVHNGQSINISRRDFESSQPNQHPGHLQTPTLQHSEDSVQKPQSHSKIDLKSKEQAQPWPVSHDPDVPSTVHLAKVSLPSQHLMPSFQITCQNPITTLALSEDLVKRHEMLETGEICVPKEKIEVKDFKGSHPQKEKQITIRSRAISQGERLRRVSPSIQSSTQITDTTKTWIPGKGEVTSKSPWDNITGTASKYRTSGTKYIGQGDFLENVLPTSGTKQIQEVVTKNKVLYNTVAEIQSLVNALVRITENTEEYQSKVLGCKVESLTSQLDDPSHTPVGLHDTIHSRAVNRLSCDHVSPEIINFPFTYTGIEDQLQSGIEAQRACDPGKITTKVGIGCWPHSSLEGHNHSFRYREITDKQQSGIVHKAFDTHQNTKKGMGCACFLSPKENHPVSQTGTDWSSHSVAAQQASDTRYT
ncbi:spermatogenesis-associated protein 31E1-like [Rattus norvegicus]|uniref:spermatogenesis-associated protein 31E1-like n=1 Tax=Rattus norvegicus TaxID=10116 RepID=UPI0003D07163